MIIKRDVKLVLLIGLFLLFLCSVGSAQTKVEKKVEKKIEKLCEKTMKAMQKQQYDKASQYLKQVFLLDSQFAKAYVIQGDLYSLMMQAEKSVEAYNKALKLYEKPKPMLYFVTAEEEMKCGRYEEAQQNYLHYLNAYTSQPPLLEEVNKQLENCKFSIEAIKRPMKFAPINMGSAINSEWDEYLSTLTADEEEFIFTVRRPRDKKTICNFCATEEDFYNSFKKDGIWQERQPLGPPINTSYNEGAQSISPDGRYLFYTLCNTDFGYGSCDLYWAKRIGDRWSRARNFGPPVNTKFWESQPTIAPDGKTIYFASNRPGGEGGIDIWKTEMVEEGVFTTPENLGKIINTKYDETAPFIHADGRTLYFVSDGHPGFGGRDIFFSSLSHDNQWQTPVNLGTPINTPDDEINIVINAAGTTGYFSSDKEGGFGGQDLYYFELDERIRPIPVTYFKGKVQDAETGRALEAQIELIDLETSQLLTATTSDPETGEFLACILTGTNVLMNITHPFYPFYSENFQLQESYSELEPYEKNILLRKPKIGNTFVLRNIFFEFDKSELLPESHVELNKLVTYLKNNLTIEIEIGGHTDNVGSNVYNERLSLERAKAVYQYLISHGISASRLTYKGYGENSPIVSNDTEEGRALNRRTEFKIVGYK
jgi:outer membrane protein OmpA-like peptidoglycan-associated protein/Tol biopolymer transport system component